MFIGEGLMIVGLLRVMTVLQRDELEPQDIIALATFDINIQPDDLPRLTDPEPPQLMDSIEVPTTPRIVDILVTGRSFLPVYRPGKPKDHFDIQSFNVRAKFAIHRAEAEPMPSS